ncbi:hypothetical protein TKK_0011314 [Trichogramma kaykai]
MNHNSTNANLYYIVDPNNAKPYQCMSCDKRFSQKTTITDHLRYFCGKGPQFKCKYCEHKSINSSNILRHCRVWHKRDKPAYVRLFEKIHPLAPEHPGYILLSTSYKRFQCLKCNRRFSQKSTMIDHLRYFCGKGRQYKCPYCETLGHSSSNIYQHVRRHHQGSRAYAARPTRQPRLAQGNKRHPCPRCLRTYKHRSHMLRHYKYECESSHRFQCPYCQLPLRQRTQAWRHIKHLHPNQQMYCIDVATNTTLVRSGWSNN